MAFCVALTRAFVNFFQAGRVRLPIDLIGLIPVGIMFWITVGAYNLPIFGAVAAAVTYCAVIVQDALTSP